MELVTIAVGVSAVVATAVASWYIGSKSQLRAALTTADDIIGMLSVEVARLKRELEEAKEHDG
jgi:hypothetical protein